MKQDRKPLSEPQCLILRALDQFQAENGYPPSFRELMEKTGISTPSLIHYYLNKLEEQDYIERDRRKSRSIRLLKRPIGAAGKVVKSMGEILNFQILGRIVASAPVPVPGSDFDYFDTETVISIASSQLPVSERNRQDLFALEVQGDSMVDAMVNDGDIIVMRLTQEVHNGEMVAVWLDGKEETTLKYFYKEKGRDKEKDRIRLQPANPAYKSFYVAPETVHIQGKVVMVIRQVNQPVA